MIGFSSKVVFSNPETFENPGFNYAVFGIDDPLEIELKFWEINVTSGINLRLSGGDTVDSSETELILNFTNASPSAATIALPKPYKYIRLSLDAGGNSGHASCQFEVIKR